MKRPSRLVAGLALLAAGLVAAAVGFLNSADAAPGDPVELSSFQSPSGNIACQIYDDTVRCEVRDRSYATPAKPVGGCDNSAFSGNNITMSADRTPHFSCASDTVLNAALPIIGYGVTTRVGRISCTSSSAHMHCKLDDGQASFQLAREAYRLS